MSGVCGWIGCHAEHPDETLQRMADRLSRFDCAPLSWAACPTAAVASSGDHRTACVVDEDGLQIAISGHPRWENPGERGNTAAGSARAFLAAYREKGPDALRSLKGDFSLALVDAKRDEALIAIDRIGVRNMLYQETHDGLVFGTNADALRAHPRVRRDVDHQGIYDYVYFHMIPGPQTAYRDQRRLLPGHYLYFQRGRVSTRPYWEMAFLERERDGVERLKAPFMASLRDGLATYADEDRCGAFLSGGTDSSTVAGLLAEHPGRRARTYSIGFDAAGYDEMAYARLASKHFGTEHHEYYVTPDDVVRAIPAIADVYDLPFGNASAVPTYFCARMAREDGIARLLGGDGGDELFGGNERYVKQYQLSLYERVPPAVRRGLVEPTLARFPGAGRVPLLRKARSYVQQASLPMPARYEAYNLLERLGAANVFTADFLADVDPGHPLALLSDTYEGTRAESLINRMLALDIKFTLADSDLPKVTRMCELAGVDVAFPMLHEAVVEFSASLAPDLKLKGTKLRYFFKEALRGFLPDEILAKEKHGFGLPVGAWLQGHSAMRELAGDTLHSLKTRAIVRPAFIDSLLDNHLARHAGYFGTMVWILMMLELWFQKHAAATSG